MKVHGQGVKEVKIVYRTGNSNAKADALSHGPHSSVPRKETDMEVQVAAVVDMSENGITILLKADAKL